MALRTIAFAAVCGIAASAAYIGVAAASPLVSFTNPSLGAVGVPVFFTNTTTDTDPSASPVMNVWSFGDGTPPINVGFGAIDHTYNSVGQYTIALTVTNSQSETAADTGTIKIIENFRPTANAGPAQTITLGSPLLLDGTGSTDPNLPDGDLLSFSWDVNNDGIFGEITGAFPLIPFAQLAGFGFATLGDRTVSLSVMDSFGRTSTDSTVVTVVAAAPTAVPEPTSLAVLSASLLGLAWARRKREVKNDMVSPMQEIGR
jgi:hypothetical protein